MADIVAEPIVPVSGQAVPTGMELNPVLDWSPVLGVPLWVLLTIAIIVFGPVLINIYYFRKVGRLASIRGWLESMQKMTKEDVQVWVISRVQRLTIDCMQIKDNVISVQDFKSIEMWYHKSPMARIIVGGNPGLVVSEDYHVTRDFISEIALTYNCDEYNADQARLNNEKMDLYDANKAEGKVTKLPELSEPIIDYTSYDEQGRENLFQMYPEGLFYPAYNIFNPTKFRKYFPLGDSATHLGGDVIEESKDFRIRRKDPGFMEKYLIFGTCAMFALIVVIAAWFVPLNGG
jgi:hypothetical protein